MALMEIVGMASWKLAPWFVQRDGMASWKLAPRVTNSFTIQRT